MNKDNQAAILSEYFPHKHFFKMNNRGEEICLIGMDVTNRGKRVSFMKQFPCKKLPNSKLQGFAKEASQDLPHGMFSVIQKDGMVYCCYTRMLATCFGYRNKKENYTILVEDGVKRIQDLSVFMMMKFKEKEYGT